MTGGFHLEAGQMTITGTDGRRRFNSDDGLFHVINSLSGSVGIGNLSFASGKDVNRTDDYVLGSCNAACTDVIGSVKFTLNNYKAGVAFDRWTTIMGGSILWVIDGHALTGTSPDPNFNIYQMIWYTFLVSGGQVTLRRRAYCSQNSRGTYTVLSHTIQYKLKAGLFT